MHDKRPAFSMPVLASSTINISTDIMSMAIFHLLVALKYSLKVIRSLSSASSTAAAALLSTFSFVNSKAFLVFVVVVFVVGVAFDLIVEPSVGLTLRKSFLLGNMQTRTSMPNRIKSREIMTMAVTRLNRHISFQLASTSTCSMNDFMSDMPMAKLSLPFQNLNLFITVCLYKGPFLITKKKAKKLLPLFPNFILN